MSIRSVDMMHAKSTLAVSAIILGGLVAASPFPYPRAPEEPPQRAVSVIAPDLAETAGGGDWIDPPARLPARAEAPAVAPIASEASTVVPDIKAPVAEPSTPAPTLASKPSDHAAKLAAKRAEQAKRRRLALAAARKRQDALRQDASGEREVASAAPAAAPADPITSLLRGLGFGRQG